MEMFVGQKDLIDAGVSIQEPLMYVYFIRVFKVQLEKRISVHSTMKCYDIVLAIDHIMRRLFFPS